MTKRYIIHLMRLTVIIFLIFFSLSPVMATESGIFEISYLGIGEGLESFEEGGLPVYIIYIAWILISASLAITVFSFVKGGLLWISSEGNPAKVKDSKEQFFSSLMGFIIILSSFLFLSAINPELVEIDHTEEAIKEERFPYGIYLVEDGSAGRSVSRMKDYILKEEGVYKKNHSNRDVEEIGRRAKNIIIANPTDEDGNLFGYYYAVILHDETSYRGRCEFFVNKTTTPKMFTASGNFASITIVQIKEDYPGEGFVRVHHLPDFKEEPAPQLLNISIDKFSALDVEEVWSIDVEGSYLLLLASGNSWETTSEGCSVFLNFKPIPDLKGNPINQCDPWDGGPPWFSSYNSCATHYALFPLFR